MKLPPTPDGMVWYTRLDGGSVRMTPAQRDAVIAKLEAEGMPVAPQVDTIPAEALAAAPVPSAPAAKPQATPMRAVVAAGAAAELPRAAPGATAPPAAPRAVAPPSDSSLRGPKVAAAAVPSPSPAEAAGQPEVLLPAEGSRQEPALPPASPGKVWYTDTAGEHREMSEEQRCLALRNLARQGIAPPVQLDDAPATPPPPRRPEPARNPSQSRGAWSRQCQRP